MRRALAALAIVALAAPAAASAHARLVETVPADGAVLPRAPRTVVVRFADTVRPGGDNAAIANGSGASIMAGAARVQGRSLILPLRGHLGRGDYSVRWSIVSEDGHRETGVLAFAIGRGLPPPQPELLARSSFDWGDLVLRWVWYAGLLVAGGAVAFAAVARGLLPPDRLRRPLAHLFFFAFLAAFVGGSGIAHGAASGTRFSLVLDLAVVVALVGATAAALAPGASALLTVAQACGLALLVAPTLAGHALDSDQPAVLAPLVDLAHIAAAATWLGGIAGLLVVLPRATDDPDLRRQVVFRFSTVALLTVVVLGATGVGRAWTELRAPSQLWSTSYGRTIVVKTALFVPLVGLGWLNRTRLLDSFARLRGSLRVELVLLCGIVVAVGVLTQLRPGKQAVPPAGRSVPGAARVDRYVRSTSSPAVSPPASR